MGASLVEAEEAEHRNKKEKTGGCPAARRDQGASPLCPERGGGNCEACGAFPLLCNWGLYMCVHVYVHACLGARVCLHVCLCTCVSLCVCMCLCVCVHV